jgi:hypothetical protein
VSATQCKELNFLLDDAGALIAYQEKGASWAGVLAFSTEERAREFCRQSHVDASEVAAIATDDREAVARLITDVKRRAIRNLLLDLDYRTGKCTRIEFDGDGLGAAAEHQFAPPEQARH